MTYPQRKRNRLLNYDYSSNGDYFVTICVNRMRHVFGQVSNARMHLNSYGKIVEHAWFSLPRHYPNCFLDESIIMPNHFHGIIHIENIKGDTKQHGLSEFIRAFKSFSSRRINELNPELNFRWKRSFYDHISRDANDYLRIARYIENNPAKWERDKFFKPD